MARIDGTVIDQNEARVSGALVYVYDSPGGLAALEDSLSQAIDNPVTTDEDGYWEAYVDDGYYTAKYYWGGRLRYVEANILAGDPPVGPNADPNLRIDLADEDAGDTLVATKRPETGAAKRTGRAKILEAWISPEDFRLPGETDDQCLAKFAAALGDNVNGKLLQDYEITEAISLDGQSKFSLMSNGATITIAAGTPTSEAHCAFLIVACTDAWFEGFKVDGNRTNRVPAEASGHQIKLHGANKRLVFRDIHSDNATTDGWFIAAVAGSGIGGGPALDELPYDLLFEGCHADFAYRNGMSIIDGRRIVVRGGSYTRASGNYTAGAGPCAGIDVEPDLQPTWIQNRVDDVLIENVKFEANDGFQLLVTKRDGVHKVRSVNCTFDDSKLGAISASARGFKAIHPVIDGWDDANPTTAAKRGCIDIPFGAEAGIAIDSPQWKNITATDAALSLVYVHAGATGPFRLLNPDVEGAAINVALLRADAGGVEGGTIRNVTKSLAIDLEGTNCFASGVGFADQLGICAGVRSSGGHIVDCRAIEPVNSAGSAVFFSAAAKTRLERLTIRKGVADAGIGIETTVAIDNLKDNTVDGVTGEPFKLGGAAAVQENNNANGVVLETDSIALTDAATITPNLALGRNFHVTLAGNRTLANPTNLRTGHKGRIRVVQDGTGSRTLGYGTAWKFPGGAPTLTTTAGAVDVISYLVHDATNIEATIEKAFA